MLFYAKHHDAAVDAQIILRGHFGGIQLDEVKTLPLDQVNEAFRLLEEREIFGKVVVKP